HTTSTLSIRQKHLHLSSSTLDLGSWALVPVKHNHLQYSFLTRPSGNWLSGNPTKSTLSAGRHISIKFLNPPALFFSKHFPTFPSEFRMKWPGNSFPTSKNSSSPP